MPLSEERIDRLTDTELLEAYEQGWRMAVNWSGREDLIADIDSPAYKRDRDEALACAIERAVVEEGAKWQPIETAPRDGTQFLAAVDGRPRIVAWAKTSHIPLYGFCLADQGIEDFDICEPDGWMPPP